MKHKNKLLIGMSGFVLFFNSCVTFSKFYHSYYDGSSISEELLLQNGEEPQVFYSAHIDDDAAEMESKHYVPVGRAHYIDVGYSSFVSEVQKAALKLCKEKKAKIALYSYEYIGTENVTLALPTTQTSRSSGTIYSGGNSAQYSGTTTYKGTTNFGVKRPLWGYDVILFVALPERESQRSAWGVMTLYYL